MESEAGAGDEPGFPAAGEALDAGSLGVGQLDRGDVRRAGWLSQVPRARQSRNKQHSNTQRETATVIQLDDGHCLGAPLPCTTAGSVGPTAHPPLASGAAG
jgi:hypothetical protein